jgi:hypothetical protein
MAPYPDTSLVLAAHSRSGGAKARWRAPTGSRPNAHQAFHNVVSTRQPRDPDHQPLKALPLEADRNDKANNVDLLDYITRLLNNKRITL